MPSPLSRTPAHGGRGIAPPGEGASETAPHATAKLQTAPFGTSEDVFEAGATLYRARCASCHGTPGHAAAGHANALQLWQKDPRSGGTGVSREAQRTVFESIADGAPRAGMPAYRASLTETQIWQVTLLLGSAGEDLPDPVLHLLETAGR